MFSASYVRAIVKNVLRGQSERSNAEPQRRINGSNWPKTRVTRTDAGAGISDLSLLSFFESLLDGNSRERDARNYKIKVKTKLAAKFKSVKLKHSGEVNVVKKSS
jgi:hypothetical protein